MSKSIIESLVSNAAAPEFETLIQPTEDVNQLGNVHVLEGADTKDTISPNAICKYFNLRLELGLNEVADLSGFYEYALALFTEESSTPTPGSTFSNVNTQTLGDIAINRYRGKTLWNGSFPISQSYPKCVDIKLKIPSKWCKWQRGQYLMLIHYFRGVDVNDTSSTLRVVWSSQWKCYL